MKNQLAKFDKICHFCGVPLSKDSVNSICGRNMNRTDDLGYCKNTPARENLNTGFHYFDVSVWFYISNDNFYN